MKAHQKGMTLLEVMAAILIFAIAAVALLASITLNAKSEMQLEEKSIASWVADNQLAQASLEDMLFPGSPIQGESEMYGQTWYWRQSGQAVPEFAMWQNQVEVRASPDQQAPLVRLTTLMAMPTSATNDSSTP